MIFFLSTSYIHTYISYSVKGASFPLSPGERPCFCIKRRWHINLAEARLMKQRELTLVQSTRKVYPVSHIIRV